MIDNAYLLNIGFYVIFGSIALFLLCYFLAEFKIKRKRQKEWDSIKEYFNCADELSVRRLFQSYKCTIEKHWLLGYIYPDM